VIHVGVLTVVLQVPGARTLKDSRRVIASLRDRVRHKFDVSFHEVDAGESVTRRAAVITTGGGDARVIRSVLDQIRAFLESAPDSVVLDLDLDVIPWHDRDVRSSVSPPARPIPPADSSGE
jgi:hypothetical protein